MKGSIESRLGPAATSYAKSVAVKRAGCAVPMAPATASGKRGRGKRLRFRKGGKK